ncbi:MAG: phage tail tape measure protein [Pseudoxanthomonas spadix]|nr:MAG: phage tail tape measure protein [Pseudoxanthomonas spadix]
MNDAVGVARIDIEIDTAKIEPGVNRAKQTFRSLTNEVEQGSAKQVTATKAQQAALERQIATYGKSRDELIRWRIEQQTSGKVQQDLLAKLDRQVSLTQKAGTSQAQLNNALRQTPAQLTDIIVGLQGGQAPLTVLLQQGGQLRDMFGSVGAAARGLGSAALGLVNPFTVSAASIAALTYAWYQGSSEAERYNASIISTGNYAQRSAAQMAAMATALDKLPGVTTHAAAAALAEVAQTGQFTGEQFDLAAQAATQWQAATGRAVAETVTEFSKIAKDPVAGLLELNDKYHFLTEAQLENIRTLKEQGREQEAVTAGFRAYAGMVDERTPQIVANLGTVKNALRSLKELGAEVMDTIYGIGRAPDANNLKRQLDYYDKVISDWNNRGSVNPEAFGIKAPLPMPDLATAQLQRQQTLRMYQQSLVGSLTFNTGDKLASSSAAAAQQAWDKRQESLDKAKKTAAEIARIQAEGVAAGKSQAEIDATIAAYKKQQADQAQKAAKADPAVSIIDRLKNQIALNGEQLKSTDALTASERLHISVQTELDSLGGKITAKRREEILALLAEVDATGKLVDAKTEEGKAKEQLARLDAQLAVAEANQRSANSIALAGYGLGSDDIQKMQRQLDLRRIYEDGLKQLRDRGVAEGTESYRMQEARLKESLERMTAEEAKYQAERLVMMRDWTNGATAAYRDYEAEAADVASQSASAFHDAFSTAEDAVVQFVRTGKLSFTDFANSVIANIARMAAKQALVSGVGALGQAFGPKITGFAKGGTFNSPSLSAYSGQVIDRPTLFAFAKGAGLMGEAGPEAVMPLTRTSGGKLGVVASGGGSMQVEINNYGSSNVTPRQETTRMPDGTQLRKLVIDIAADDMASGGKLTQATKRRLDVRDRV